ncbi:low affinity iron permease family protein [Rhodocytophaga rosea]|uniref:Low affinity iron permease family protein n=1 Tax=Rhodocytophaga rosea TaxID=2704465 RepID=A0A6C0GFE0_9BACT|nr:low affinity iron permease family protein [Rhodocytophaga rosea]QHT66483.1 low affinity iron permease family protein [Rhodocytophaga rosea]
MENSKEKLVTGFEKFSNKVTALTGSSGAFMLALFSIIIWLCTGPIFNYSDTWQLVINTGTTIVTFLMVFLIQKSQNKESMAVQLKLNELIAANKGASNRLVNVENLTEQELKTLHQHYCKMAELTKQASDLKQSHSIEEAIENAYEKLEEENKENGKTRIKSKVVK